VSIDAPREIAFFQPPVIRVTGEDVPMPYSRSLEVQATPHEEDIVRAVKQVMYR